MVGENLWNGPGAGVGDAGRPRILVVEDESIVALDIKMHLERYGYEVPEPVVSGEEAIVSAESLEPSLVLMDIKLQGRLDGLAAAREIRRRFNLPVVMLTAHADETTVERALGSEPYAYIIKPFEERELRTTVAVALSRHHLERAVADREKLLATTLNSIGEGVVVTDEEGRVRFANPTALDLVGRVADAVIGMPFTESFRFVPEETGPAGAGAGGKDDDLEIVELARAEHQLRQAPPRQAPLRQELLRENGDALTIEKTVMPLMDDGDHQVGNVWVIRDVSQRIAWESALEESREQLRQAQKMEAVGRLSGGIAHDFNNLLTAILGYTRLARTLLEKDQNADLERILEDIVGIESVAQRSVALTRQLLTFSRRQHTEPELLDLNSVVSSLDGMIRRLLSDDIQLRVALSQEPVLVWADRGQLEQIILNLTVNARDAMGQGGVLSLATERARFDREHRCKTASLPPGSYVRLDVHDTGVGMDAETLERIFEPFFTTKERESGTGLGLSTVYGIVQQASGALDVESDRRSGSVFRVYLPARSGTPVTEATAEPPQEEYRGAERILLVERDSHVLSVLSRALRNAGYQVIGVANPGEAILVVEEAYTPIDLLVTDAIMPHIDGIRLAQRVRGGRPGLKVVLLSSYPEQLPEVLPEELTVEFLQKPFEPADFLRRVRTLLDS